MFFGNIFKKENFFPQEKHPRSINQHFLHLIWQSRSKTSDNKEISFTSSLLQGCFRYSLNRRAERSSVPASDKAIAPDLQKNTPTSLSERQHKANKPPNRCHATPPRQASFSGSCYSREMCISHTGVVQQGLLGRGFASG